MISCHSINEKGGGIDLKHQEPNNYKAGCFSFNVSRLRVNKYLCVRNRCFYIFQVFSVSLINHPWPEIEVIITLCIYPLNFALYNEMFFINWSAEKNYHE